MKHKETIKVASDNASLTVEYLPTRLRITSRHFNYQQMKWVRNQVYVSYKAIEELNNGIK